MPASFPPIKTSDSWNTWVNHWRFANYTGFRIPEYLTSVVGAWRQVSKILLASKEQPEPIHFFRHPLLGDRDGKGEGADKKSNETPIVQFTQSSLLAKLLSNGGAVEAKFTTQVEELKQKLSNKKADWDNFLSAIAADPGSNFSEVELDIEFLKTLPDLDLTSTDYPRLFHHLFLAFSSVSHRGFLQFHLNEHHLKFGSEDREKLIGYWVETRDRNEDLPHIEWIRALHFGGSLDAPFVKNKKQQTPFDILREREDEELRGREDEERRRRKDEEFGGLLFALWNSVNERSTRASGETETNHYFAVPVYAWSEAPKNSEQSKTSRFRGGALLGWALHRFAIEESDKELEWPTIESQPLNSEGPLYQHVRSLCFMMEDFAVNYLTGETEWALERPWSATDTPESFMQLNFHHSCGWECLKVERGEEMKAYFEWDAEKRILLVNLNRQLPSKGAQSSGPSTIAHLRPNSLCLAPSNGNARDDYHASVAEKARQFYARCLAIAEQRKQAEQQGWQSGIREDREIHEFMWAHETRKLSRALVQCDQSVVRDLIGRHLVAMTYPARGEPDRLSEANDLKHYWPSPYSVLCGPAKDWMWAIHDFSARRWALTRYALEAASHGSGFEKLLDEFCESSRKELRWNEMWDALRIDDTFPGPARKFFTRLWLAAFSNYFKHRETQTAKPPCLLDIRESNVTGILLISQSNFLGKASSDSGKELGTKDILNYDLLNAARWREKSRVSVFGPIHEQDLIGLVKFEALSNPPLQAETRFVTQVPIPRTFFT